MMTGFGWSMGLGGWLWMGLGAVLLVVLVWVVIATLNGRGESRHDDSLRILRERFARGEISEAEFQEARRLLG